MKHMEQLSSSERGKDKESQGRVLLVHQASAHSGEGHVYPCHELSPTVVRGHKRSGLHT